MSEITETNDPNEAAARALFDKLNNSIEFYNQPPAENELDLVALTRKALTEAGAEEAKLVEAFDNHRFIIEAHGKHAHAQQFLMNRWLNDQFMWLEQQGGDSRLYRYQLIYEIRPSEWLVILKQSIAPNFVEFGLPYVSSHHG